MDHYISQTFYGMPQNVLKFLTCFLIFGNIINIASSYGYDSANSCSPNGKLSRRGREQIVASIPCDLTSQVYCQLPGSSYPWHAVRRFVHENQGLMKRMYGDIRHISILRAEIQNNEIEFEDIEMAADRYSRGGSSRSSKSIQKNYPESNNMEPYFQPISTTPTSESKLKSKASSSSPLQASTDEIANSSTENLETNDPNPTLKSFDITNKLVTNVNILPADFNSTLFVEELEHRSKDATSIKLLSEEEENTALNSVFETPTNPHLHLENGNNIQIVESPVLTRNNSLEETSISPTPKTSQPLNSPTTNVVPSNSNENKHTTLSQQSHNQQQYIDSKTNLESLKTKSKLNESEPLPHSSQVKGFTTTSPQKDKQNQYKNKNTQTNSPLSSSSIPAMFSTVLKSNSDLFSGEKVQRPTKSPAAVAATATKPVLRDGQLFQDTMKQESTTVPNLRGVNACPVKEEVVAPFWANNTRGEVLALLNLYPFEQYVHWEKCTYEFKQMYCREGCRCEQQYRLHRLLAYDPHNECRGIFSDWFRFPSCCICKCYDIPLDFRATSRSPRSEGRTAHKHPIEIAEENVKKAIYEHATDEFYRPKDDFDLFEN